MVGSKVVVDFDRCEGHGLCEVATPKVYQLDDEGELIILVEDLPDDLVESAKVGARACPVAAIRIEQL